LEFEDWGFVENTPLRFAAANLQGLEACVSFIPLAGYSVTMPDAVQPECPDCGDPLAFAFTDASGVGAHKRGDNFNTTPDTDHYVCFPCGKAWKQRLSGPFTPDVVGDLAFFSCRQPACGARLAVTRESATPTALELACSRGHRYAIQSSPDGSLTLADRA
jgi:hypothetical protein